MSLAGSNDLVIQQRSLPPGGDLVFTQTPTQQGLVVNEEDSWDLAEQKAAEEKGNGAPADVEVEIDSDIESSTSSGSASANGMRPATPAQHAVAAGASSSAATASTASTASTNGTAASGANRMTSAVPANASLRERLRAGARPYHFCACTSLILLTAGTIFTLMAKGIIPHRDSGYTYPEEFDFDKVMAGIWFVAAAITSGITIGNAVHHYRRGNG